MRLDHHAFGQSVHPAHWRQEGCQRLDFETAIQLRSLLVPEIRAADRWEDLIARLHGKGFTIKIFDGQTFLYSWPTGGRICPTELLGYSMGALEGRFNRGSEVPIQ